MSGKRILIVEDTELLRRMYRDRLVQDGYDVADVADGLSALALMRERSFDLLLLDLIMPRMGGLQVLEAVKQDPRTKDTPVLVLTNLGEEETIERAVALGAIDYLIKNETRPAAISDKVKLVLASFAKADSGDETFVIYPDQSRGDVDAFVTQAGLKRRLWCPACESELAFEFIPDAKRPGWYQARVICPSCGKAYSGS